MLSYSMEKIKTARECAFALREAEKLIDKDPEMGTEEAGRLNELVKAITEYEYKIYGRI